MDFTGTSTERLRAESLKRASDVSSVNDAAWDAVGPAYAAAVPFVIAGTICLALSLDTGELHWTIMLAVPAGVVAWMYFMPWLRAIRACQKYTREMNARTAEIKRRNQSAAH